MAKKTLSAPPREVAQIVAYMTGVAGNAPVVVRYHDMQVAKKQYEKLLKAADDASLVVLSSACMTATFRHPQNISLLYLVDVEANNFLIVDTQKRNDAMRTA